MIPTVLGYLKTKVYYMETQPPMFPVFRLNRSEPRLWHGIRSLHHVFKKHPTQTQKNMYDHDQSSAEPASQGCRTMAGWAEASAISSIHLISPIRLNLQGIPSRPPRALKWNANGAQPCESIGQPLTHSQPSSLCTICFGPRGRELHIQRWRN